MAIQFHIGDLSQSQVLLRKLMKVKESPLGAPASELEVSGAPGPPTASVAIRNLTLFQKFVLVKCRCGNIYSTNIFRAPTLPKSSVLEHTCVFQSTLRAILMHAWVEQHTGFKKKVPHSASVPSSSNLFHQIWKFKDELHCKLFLEVLIGRHSRDSVV